VAIRSKATVHCFLSHRRSSQYIVDSDWLQYCSRNVSEYISMVMKNFAKDALLFNGTRALHFSLKSYDSLPEHGLASRQLTGNSDNR